MRRASHSQQDSAVANIAQQVPELARFTSHTLYDIELDTLRRSLSVAPDPPNDRQTQVFSLPPTDQGREAWSVLAAAFFVELFAWGIPFTFGVFQEYYSSLPEFEGEHGSVAIIGTIALGGMYLASPISLISLQRWPRVRRSSAIIGLAIVALALTTASFATHVWQLVLTQGAMYAVGASMLYYPVLLFIDEWFVRRKGLAYGIAWSAAGFSGVAFPFFVSWSLQHYSFRTTLRVLAVVYVAIITPTFFFLKARLPVPASIGNRAFPSIRFTWTRSFLPCQVGNILESLGFFMPGLFLPTYARSLGYSTTISTATVVLLNGGAFLGSMLTGFLVDKWHVTNVIIVVTMVATLSVTLLWGFASSAIQICIFAFIYGISAGSFASTWPGVVSEAQRQNPQVETGIAYATLVAGRGIGSVVSGPLSDLLLEAAPFAHSFSYGYGSKYAGMIVFVGLFNAMGCMAFVARHLQPK